MTCCSLTQLSVCGGFGGLSSITALTSISSIAAITIDLKLIIRRRIGIITSKVIVTSKVIITAALCCFRCFITFTRSLVRRVCFMRTVSAVIILRRHLLLDIISLSILFLRVFILSSVPIVLILVFILITFFSLMLLFFILIVI